MAGSRHNNIFNSAIGTNQVSEYSFCLGFGDKYLVCPNFLLKAPLKAFQADPRRSKSPSAGFISLKQTYVAVRQRAEVRYATTAVRREESNRERRLLSEQNKQVVTWLKRAEKRAAATIVFRGLRLKETSSDVASKYCFWKFD